MSSPRPTLVLEVLTPCAQLGNRYVLHPDQKLLLGRTALSDLVFDHGTVSRRHAWVWYEEGQWRVEDAGSHPGTYLDDESVPVGLAHPLRTGATLRLGGFDLRVSEGAPDLAPSIPLGVYPRFAGEAAEKARREAEAAQRAQPPPPPPPPPPRFAGRFTLAETLGRGNQGVVHAAFDHEGNGRVALKIFDTLTDDGQIQKFLAGAAAKATRDRYHFHEHLAWGVVDGTPYLAMALVNGERLTDRLKNRPISLGEAVRMARSLAGAVGTLHEEGLLHRNVKPDNVWLSDHAPTRPLLSDIWVDMHRSHRLLYRKELMRASLGFLAPEQARTGEADPRSDVYSVAAILYRSVAGCMPIPEHDPGAEVPYGSLGLSGAERAQPLLEVRPDAPPELCELLARALSPSPGDRPAHGYALLLELAKVEDTLGLEKGQLPCPIVRGPGGRRAAPRPRAPIDPFTDKVFQQELIDLVLPRCKDERAHGYLYGVLLAHHHAERASLMGCALCGIPYVGQVVVEIRPEGFVLIPAEGASRARRPYLCRNCTWGDFRAAYAAIREALGALAGRDDEPLRPLGPTRRELREGLSTLLADARPHLDESAACSRCARRHETLAGAEMNLCLSCLGEVRAAGERRIEAERRLLEERVRAEYAKLHVRAEQRLVRLGKRTRVTPERDVVLPAKGSKGDWWYLDVEGLERAEEPQSAEIDRVGRTLCSSIEAHVLESLRAAQEEKKTGSRFEIQCASGLPGYVKRYVDRFRPGAPVAYRLDLAIAVMSELLRAGYRYTHQVEDYEWRDATGYFEIFHDLADRPARS